MWRSKGDHVRLRPLEYSRIFEHIEPLIEATLGWLRISRPDVLYDMVVDVIDLYTCFWEDVLGVCCWILSLDGVVDIVVLVFSG